MPAPLDVTSSEAFLDALGLDTDQAVADRFDLHPRTVAYHRNKLGIPPTGQIRAMMVDSLIQSGMSNHAICQETGMSRAGVRKRRAALGAPASTDAGGAPRKAGRVHRKVLKMLRAGHSVRAIARETGMSRKAIVRRRDELGGGA